jgi:hypothetical protein
VACREGLGSNDRGRVMLLVKEVSVLCTPHAPLELTEFRVLP